MIRYENKDVKDIDWTKYKIVVPTNKDKKELMEAFKHFHDNSFDSEYVTVNQLAHEYIEGSNIIVDENSYDELSEQSLYPEIFPVTEEDASKIMKSYSNKLNNLKSTINEYLKNTKYIMSSLQDKLLYETFMNKFKIDRKYFGSIDIFVQQKLILTIQPRGIMSCRLDIMYKNGSESLMDTAGLFEEPIWKINERKGGHIDFNEENFFKILDKAQI
jgi:hypothetical protein